MVDENEIPHEDEPPAAQPADDDSELTADVIDEADLEAPEARLSSPEGSVQQAPDFAETEPLPQIPDELREDWQRVLDSEDAETPEAADEVVQSSAKPELPPTPQPKAKPAPPPPAKPEWKIQAEKLFEEREAQKRLMMEQRREYEESRRTHKEQHETELHSRKEEFDARIKAEYDLQKEEHEGAVKDMMQHLREEKERKRKEREVMDEKLRLEREQRSYKANRDIDSRANRLSKDEE